LIETQYFPAERCGECGNNWEGFGAPVVTADGKGSAIAVWLGNDRYKPGLWGYASAVGETYIPLDNKNPWQPYGGYAPRISSDDAGNAIALFANYSGTGPVEYHVRHYTGATKTWQNVIGCITTQSTLIIPACQSLIATSTSGNGAALTVGANGNAVVVFGVGNSLQATRFD
jgi:hypothetical protein